MLPLHRDFRRDLECLAILSGTNCDQPMFKFADSRNGDTLVDIYYELKFWQAAP